MHETGLEQCLSGWADVHSKTLGDLLLSDLKAVHLLQEHPDFVLDMTCVASTLLGVHRWVTEMLGVRVDTVFHEALAGPKAPVWGRFAAWLSKPGAVPSVAGGRTTGAS
jgi:hypothetical protein